MSETKKTRVKLTEGQWSALSVLGFLWLRLGVFDKAERLFKALAAIRPDDVRAAASSAVASLSQGRFQEALDQVNLLMAEKPLATTESYLLLVKAQALWRLNRADEASSSVQEFLSMTPGSDGANL